MTPSAKSALDLYTHTAPVTASRHSRSEPPHPRTPTNAPGGHRRSRDSERSLLLRQHQRRQLKRWAIVPATGTNLDLLVLLLLVMLLLLLLDVLLLLLRHVRPAVQVRLVLRPAQRRSRSSQTAGTEPPRTGPRARRSRSSDRGRMLRRGIVDRSLGVRIGCGSGRSARRRRGTIIMISVRASSLRGRSVNRSHPKRHSQRMCQMMMTLMLLLLLLLRVLRVLLRHHRRKRLLLLLSPDRRTPAPAVDRTRHSGRRSGDVPYAEGGSLLWPGIGGGRIVVVVAPVAVVLRWEGKPIRRTGGGGIGGRGTWGRKGLIRVVWSIRGGMLGRVVSDGRRGTGRR